MRLPGQPGGVYHILTPRDRPGGRPSPSRRSPMRRIVALLAVALAAAGLAQDAKPEKPAVRYGVEPELERYPQATPKEALRSVLKAIDAAHFDYLLAQLTDPEFVDLRVKERNGKFDKVVEETRALYAADPEKARTLRRF